MIRAKGTDAPTLLYALVRPSRVSDSRYKVHLLCKDPGGGKDPLQVKELRLEMN